MTEIVVSRRSQQFATRMRTNFAYNVPVVLSLFALLAIFAAIVAIQPDVLSSSGVNLVLTSAVPLVVAAQAQMILMAVGDIDLGLGNLVGLLTVISASLFVSAPLLGVLLLVGIVAIYALIGYFVQQFSAPSIIVTLGLSFVWFGVGVQLLPSPGGATPDWLGAVGAWNPDLIPAPVIYIVAATVVGWAITCRSLLGTRMRALGSNAATLSKIGHSAVMTRVVAYVVAALIIIVAGLLLASQTRSGDINSAGNFTLISIAAVILGGGTFTGGRALPLGATLGVVTLSLITVLLSLVNLSSNLQSAAQGTAVLLVLAGRVATDRLTR